MTDTLILLSKSFRFSYWNFGNRFWQLFTKEKFQYLFPIAVGYNIIILSTLLMNNNAMVATDENLLENEKYIDF